MNQESNLYCLVMAGGKGTRFWPESTSKRPKQYLNLVGDKSLLSETLERFEGLVDKKRRFVVTVKEQEGLAHSSSSEFTGENAIIFEPSGRNTAPCILLSLASLLEGGASENDVVAIVPSDHIILNTNGFREVIATATTLARENPKIVVIGMPPTFPHTGYGYIQRGDETESGVYKVSEFREKPDFETAKSYVASGSYYWNGGMFVASIKTMLAEFEIHAPEMFKSFAPLREAVKRKADVEKLYSNIPADSIDYAVMEKSKNVLVVPATFDWNDLGSWDALADVIEKCDENIIVTDNGHYFEEAKDNIIFAPNQFVSLINVNDLIVVSNDKALVVLPKKDSQKVKSIVEHLKTTELAEELL